MKKRTFGKVDFKSYPLGFGCMRFPTIDNKIDEAESIKMVRTAIDRGVNYIDTAYPYHGGESELLVAKALKDGYRERVKLATKAPVWFFESADDYDKYLNEQLKKLEVDYIDFYLLHALNGDSFNKLLKMDIFKKVDESIKDGRIKHIGFSYHDKPENFKPILDSYDWSFVQIQLNYLDEDYQAGLNGYNMIKERGMGIVIMEPLLGGKLANLPEKITSIFKECNDKTPVEWALDYLWNMDGVSVILSGMSNMEQTLQNIEYADRAEIGMFSEKEMETIKKVQKKFNEIASIPCTKCSYCMPCPHGVDIPWNFTLYNESFMFDIYDKNKNEYTKISNDNTKTTTGNNCVACGVCLSKCPQSIDIPNQLENVNSYFN